MIQIHVLKVKYSNFVNYCFVAANTRTKSALLIDPAWEPNVIETLLASNGLYPAAVLLTHHHPDHVHLAPYFAEHYNIPVYMGKAEIGYYNYQCTNLIPILSEAFFEISDIKIYPLATPGHTYGGICYLIEQSLFTGDTLFNEGCGMCFGAGADPLQLYSSLQKLKQDLSENTIIYPGHCFNLPVGQTFAEVLKYNIYLQFQDPESFVAFRMRKAQGDMFKFK